MAAHLFKKYGAKLPPSALRLFLNLWAPYRGAGIRMVHLSGDYREVDVEMKLRWFNTNYVGTHFGGSLYAMTDPFYMLMLIQNLGPDYIVWDKAAKIDFKKPGRGTVRASFRFSETEIADIRAKADSLEKVVFDRPVDVIDEKGDVVASIIKTLYVRRKQK